MCHHRLTTSLANNPFKSFTSGHIASKFPRKKFSSERKFMHINFQMATVVSDSTKFFIKFTFSLRFCAVWSNLWNSVTRHKRLLKRTLFIFNNRENYSKLPSFMTVTCFTCLRSNFVQNFFVSHTHEEKSFWAQWDIELIEHLIMSDMCDDDWKEMEMLICPKEAWKTVNRV